MRRRRSGREEDDERDARRSTAHGTATAATQRAVDVALFSGPADQTAGNVALLLEKSTPSSPALTAERSLSGSGSTLLWPHHSLRALVAVDSTRVCVHDEIWIDRYRFWLALSMQSWHSSVVHSCSRCLAWSNLPVHQDS